MNGSLKKYVKFLVEAAIEPENLKKVGMCLLVTQYKQYVIYTLYDPFVLLKHSRDQLENFQFNVPVDEIIYGAVFVTPQSEGCHNAAEISNSSASKGYGPMLYDIVMGDFPNGIYPDRRSTSKSAKNIWKYYRDNRSDVKRKPFDDKKNPQTPEPDDDCDLVNDPGDLLNYAYYGGGAGKKDSLVKNHENAIQLFKKYVGVDEKTLRIMLIYLASEHFNAMYKGASG